MSQINWNDFTPVDDKGAPQATAKQAAVNWDDFTPVDSPKSAIGSMASDALKSFKSGVEQLPGMATGIADLAPALAFNARPFTKAADAIGEATGFQPGKWAKEIQYSPNEQAAQQESQQVYKPFEDAVADPTKSKADALSALASSAPDIAKFYATHPLHTINQAIQSVPAMLAGGAASKLAMGAGALAGVAADPVAGIAARAAVPSFLERAVGEKMAAPVAGGIGEGAMQTGQQMDQGSDLPDQRKNALAALASGAADALISAGGGRLANKMGLETPETLMAKGLKNRTQAVGGIARNVVGGALSEGALQELPQSMQEQVWQNYAEGKPLMEGVVQQGIEGGLAGGLMGAGANIRGHGGEYAPAPEQPQAHSEQAPGEQAPPLALGNTPDPLLSFPDGSVARQSEVDNYLNSLPEEQRAAARAKLMGLAPQPTDIGTSPGAADPNATQREAATAPQALDATTAPGAAPDGGNGVDFTREFDTSGLGLQDPAEAERARAATVDYAPTDTTPNWGTQQGAAPERQGLDMPAPAFDTSGLSLDQRTPSQRMGIDPTAGPLSSAAAMAVDSGAHAQVQQAQALQDAAKVAQKQAPSLTQQAQAATQNVAQPANLSEGLARIRAQRQEAANAQAATQQAAAPAQTVPAARASAVEAAGAAPISPTTGVTSEPKATQAQQSIAQPAQAGDAARPAATSAPNATGPAGGRGLQAAGVSDAATAQNDGAQGQAAAGAAGTAPAPQAAVARPDGWRKSMLRAVPVARSLGIDHKGKRLAQVVAEIDARDSERGNVESRPKGAAQRNGDGQWVPAVETGSGGQAIAGAPAFSDAGTASHWSTLEQLKARKGADVGSLVRQQSLLATPPNTSKSTPVTRAGDIARGLRDDIDNVAAQEKRPDMYRQEAQRLRKAAEGMGSTTEAHESFAAAADMLDAWAGQVASAPETNPTGAPDAATPRNLRLANDRVPGAAAASQDGAGGPGAGAAPAVGAGQRPGADSAKPGAAVRAAVPDAGGAGQPAASVAPQGREVFRDIGKYKEGRSEPNANQLRSELARKNPGVVYTVEEDPALKNGYAVVGREPAPGQKLGVEKMQAAKGRAPVQFSRALPEPQDFVLGQDANDSLSGQGAMFSRTNSKKTISTAQRDEAFASWSNNAPLVTSAQAPQYEFKSGEKIVVEAFHGTKRPDRIGGVFDPKRATSGPMAFFTSSPELASSYSTNKTDTSLADEDQSFENWFRYKPAGQRSEVDIARAWYLLTPEQKATIAERMPDIRANDDGEIIYEKGGGDIGSYEWELKQTQRGYDRQGNPLKAAVETWLSSGSLFNDELEFVKVLKLAGFPVQDLRTDFPTDEFPSVFKTFIAMQKPLVVSDMPAEVLSALEQKAKTDRSRAKLGADMWDKRSRTMREWVDHLNGKNGASQEYAWTSIPDKVTDVLKSFGYDGIVDWSGKGGGHQHPVYIPFASTQVKGAFNRGTYDPTKKDINFIRATAITRADSNAQNVATQMLVDGLTEKWTKAPPIIVARNMDDQQIPQKVRDYDSELKSQGSDGEARGFIYRGKVYLLSDQLKGPQQIAETLFHEVLGHYGLRGVFGEGLTPILQQLGTMRRKDVLTKAREYGLYDKDKLGGIIPKQASDAQIWAAMSSTDRTSAAEEVLAEMAQTQPTIGFVKRAIALIRNWLRANMPGFKSLRLTDADIVAGYILPARGFVTRSNETPKQSIERAMLAFSRGDAKDQTHTEAFKKWFGDSKVVDAAGQPQQVFHGTGGDFSVFAHDNAGATSRAANAGMGFFFTDKPEVAGRYAQMSAGNQNVMPVYLSLQNPLLLSAKNMMEADKLLQAEMKPENDGAIVKVAMQDGGTQTVYMARESSQVKSTTGNNGDFNPGNQDIRFSRTSHIESSMGEMTPAQEAAYKKVAGVQKVPTARERLDSFKANLGLKMKQALVDQFAPIQDVSQQAYMLARMSKGSDGATEALLLYGKPYLRDGVLDVNIKDGGFAKVLASLKGEHDRFFMWVAAQRAERLKAEGKENLMGDEDITALRSLNAGKMADGTVRMPIYAKALQELNAFNEASLKVAQESGLIDQAAYDLMKDQPYVPFYRLMEEQGGMTGPRFSSGLLNQKAWKKLKGGTQQLNADLMQNSLLNWSHLYAASARNRAALATMDAAEGMGVAYKVGSETKGAVKVMRDGVSEHWMIEDPYLLEAVSALNYSSSPLMKPLSSLKKLLTWGVTVNPAFKIRNLIRDSIAAVAQSPLGFNPAANVARGLKLTATDSQVYASMLASGGIIKFGTQENSERLREQVAKLGGVMLDKDGLHQFTSKLKGLYEAYQEIGDRTENVNRAALYDQLIKKGYNHADASFMARDLMDFSMSGSHPAVRFLTQTVPFLNARLQGLYKLGRAAKEDPKKFAAVVGAVSLASLGLLAAYSDDDDWKKREDWDRDSYWWFKIGDTAYRIPKPFEVGAIGTIAERTAELMFDKEMTNKRFMDRIGFMVGQTFSFDPTPQAIKPLLDIYANKDSFTQRSIESQSDQRLRPQDRYNERTSEVARMLGSLGLPDPGQLVKGDYAALSPKQVDYLLHGYFSWVATAAATVSDFGLRPVMGRGERPDMRLKDVFLAGNFVESLPAGSSRYVTQLYDQAKSIEQAYASYQEAIKQGDTEKALSIKESDGDKLRKRMAYANATQQLSNINSQAKSIESDRSMPGDVKRARLTELELRRDKVARRVAELT